MGRPLTEFIQVQNLSWIADPAEPKLSRKRLSEDDETGERTLLVRLAHGWRTPGQKLDSDLEFFVLTGTLSLGETHYDRHDYAFLPAGFVFEGAGSDGATLLVFQGPHGAHQPAEPAPPILRTATIEQPWDGANVDPNVGHLHIARKNLRLAPDGRCRSYLLGGMPHGYPAHGTARLERHPHAEEMFMIAGDMPCSLGTMRAGAYFWRPPEIWHGLDCSLTGFLVFMRTPGSNRTISEWSEESYPLSFEPAHRPVLPPHFAEQDGPVPDPLAY